MEDQHLESQEKNEEKKKVSVGSWIISTLIHFAILATLTLMMLQNDKKLPDNIIISTTINEPMPPPVEIKKDHIKPEKVTFKIETNIAPQIVLNETFEEVLNPIEMEMKAITLEENIKPNYPNIGSALLGTIGTNTGKPGGLSNRSEKGKSIVGRKHGSTIQSEQKVNAALWWLANHQEEQGYWDSGKWEGKGSPETDLACTGAALLSFLASGHTDRMGSYKKNVKVALDYLIKAQRVNGSFDNRNYANGICTMALAEAFGMGCRSIELKKAAENAIDYLLKEQNPSGGFFYEGPQNDETPSNFDDMSVTGWCIMGLKSAMISGIREKEVKNAFEKCGNLLDNAWYTKDNSSTSKGEAWYRATGSQGSGKSGGACQAISMLIRQYLGWKKSEPWLDAAANAQFTSIPKDYNNMNVYRIYYTYLTLFQFGGDKWKTYLKQTMPIIIDAQRNDGDFNGSWDPNNASHMESGGRVLFTAFLCLNLEVFYRFEYLSKH